MADYEIRDGRALPFGAELSEEGVNFALFSEHASAVYLCLFDEFGQQEVQRVAMHCGENYCWHIFVVGLSAGAKYGYRVEGQYLPEKGLRFDSTKLLIDPYARDLDRSFCWDKSLFAYDLRDIDRDLSQNQLDNVMVVPKSVVTRRRDAGEIAAIQARKPAIPWRDTIIYECHVRGISQLNLAIPAHLRGTVGGLAHEATLQYLRELGVTTIELLPVHTFVDEEFLTKQGLSNYWGYNTLNFFCAHHHYLQNGHPDDFLSAVEALHAAGFEVILDVVYNHTAESSELGPTLSFRGIDNLNYYRLEARSSRYYVNDTGCGNTFKAEHPRAMQLILDSLRFWAGEMGVDGFRFDLAPILGRDEQGFSTQAALFQAMSQDPLLSRCKLIAEPWDIGPGGYQLGHFPGEWSEWNDKYRDVARRFWRGDGDVMPEFARRLHGSSDIFEAQGRGPRASVNFITSHDGFTLADLVSYRERHNLANKENNRDGHHANYSENYGCEGPSTDAAINKLRMRQQRNLLATLFFSQGTPMILAGDELGRSQDGNNNAYCQDNEINWIDWRELAEKNTHLLEYCKKVIQLRKQYPLFSSTHFIHNPEDLESEYCGARWVSCSGKPMTEKDWHGQQLSLGWILISKEDDSKTTLLLLFNAHSRSLEFVLPAEDSVQAWDFLLDTFHETGQAKLGSLKAGASVLVESRSLMLLKGI